MHVANAHEEWRAAYNQASLHFSYTNPAEGHSALHVAAVQTSTAGSDKQEQEQTNSIVVESPLGTFYQTGELSSVWDMLLQVYPRLEVGAELPRKRSQAFDVRESKHGKPSLGMAGGGGGGGGGVGWLFYHCHILVKGLPTTDLAVQHCSPLHRVSTIWGVWLAEYGQQRSACRLQLIHSS